ncbi:MAG: sugar ABC transporter permease [Clostridia bacterium]|nr:sugar ABC transporter permease [Clostridia bacterium]
MDNTKAKEKSGFSLKNLFPKKATSLNAKKARSGWLFVLPFVLGLVFLYVGVIFESIGYSFTFYHKIPAVRGGGYELELASPLFANYEDAISAIVDTKTGATFLEKMFTGFFNQIVEIIAIIMLSLFIAILLNQKMVGRAAFRAIFFIPVVVGAGIIAKIDYDNALLESMSSLEGLDTGAVASSGMGNLVDLMDISMLFENLGIGSELIETVSNLIGNIYDIVNRSGVQMLIFLAALQSISPSIYESCQMEGATSWEIFWKITLPMISPMILANAVYTVIDSFTAESNEVMSYILSIADTTNVSGRQAASAWLYFLLVIITLGLVALVMRKVVFYQRRND